MTRSRVFRVLHAFITQTEPSRPRWSPSPCQGSSSLSEGMGFCCCCCCFFSFWTTNLPHTKACLSKFISDSQTCHVIFLHHQQAYISWNLAENFSPWSLGEPTQCWSLYSGHSFSQHFFLWFPSPPFSTSMHTHQVDLHLLINGFKVLWCHIRGYVSQLTL